uniref:Transposase n=1 Tax=Plectus sambesii TaxID=2011161 RepID=A0A914UW66_9BILA
MAAITHCYANAKRLTCYYHMKKQVQKKMGPKRVPKDRTAPPICTRVNDFGPLCYWYEGAALGAVSTNNGLESLHGRIKRFGTLRKRMSVKTFVKEVRWLMQEWSRASESQPFLSVPPRVHCLLR